MKGVLLGTIVSFLVTDFWYYPYYIYNVVSKHSLIEYYLTQVLNAVVFTVVLFTTDFILNAIFTAQHNMKLLSWMTYGLSSLALALILAIPLSMVVSKPFARVMRKAFKALMSLKNGLYRRRKTA
jgi:hypothetical protein